MREKRITKVRDIIQSMNLDSCILRGMENIFYLTGFRGSEGTLLVTRDDVILFTDFRYITHAYGVTHNIKIVELKEKENALGEVCAEYGIKRMGFDSLHTSYDIYLRWKEKMPAVELVALRNIVEDIRRQKEIEEIYVISKAIDIATDAFKRVLEKIYPGQTEKDIANELEYIMRQCGAEGPSFNTIVASGIRAAMPHAEPAEKKIQEGETVVVDFGAKYEGYCSDETCTLFVGRVDEKMMEIFNVVNDAKKKAIEKVKVGMPLKELDSIVRGFIEDAGYGKFFRHGVGHGIGIAVHESPVINSMADGIIEENMVFTIEPGIYIPDMGGVRLEDMLLITQNGARVLTHIQKEILQI